MTPLTHFDRPEGRRGAVLLEVLVAMTILGLTGLSLAALARDALLAAERAADTERETREAGWLLATAALWPREDLDRRLGQRVQGRWVMRIERPLPAIYLISLRDSTGREILGTSVYRPERASVVE